MDTAPIAGMPPREDRKALLSLDVQARTMAGIFEAIPRQSGQKSKASWQVPTLICKKSESFGNRLMGTEADTEQKVSGMGKTLDTGAVMPEMAIAGKTNVFSNIEQPGRACTSPPTAHLRFCVLAHHDAPRHRDS